MASSSFWSCVLRNNVVINMCVLMMICSMASTSNGSRVFKVGDDYGWQQPPIDHSDFYIQWPQSHRFHVQDSLVFEYSNDSVVRVEERNYYECDASDPITAFDNGKSTIHLDASGPFFFISGSRPHCINGQRLIVTVLSPHPLSPVSPPSISPTSSQPSIAPAPSSTSTSSSSSDSSSSSSDSTSSSSVSLPTFPTFLLLTICLGLFAI